ncbi:MAG: hypothetical protein ACE5LU_24120 [Anaerolineae bacterium]
MMHAANEKGTALIAAVATLLILSLMGGVVVSLVGTESWSALHQVESAQALPLAEAGAHRAVGYLSREGGECAAISDNLQFTNVSLGRGTFSVTGIRYNPTPTALSADITAADTMIPVVSTAGYAPHGSITIESETIYYAGTTPISFTGARRGAAGTTAASHSASFADVVMDWTLSEATDWAMGAVVVNAAGAPSPGIAFDAAGSVVQNSTAASFTWSHTVSGSNRMLVVGVSIRNQQNETVSGVTYAGTPLTFVGTRSNETSARIEIWQLVAPAVGTDNVVVTLSAPAKIIGGAISLTGVDQTTPIAASAFTAGSSTNPTINLSNVATSAWVIDAMAFRSTGTSGPTATPGGGQDQRTSGYTETGGTAPNIRGKASSEQPGKVYQDQCLIASTGTVGSGADGTSGIAFDRFTAFGQSNCDPCQWIHTVAAAATDRILVVSFGYGDDPNAIVGVTYNGIPLTEIRTEIFATGRVASMWYLLNPPAGTSTVSVDLTAASTGTFTGASASYAGVDQTNPVEAGHVGAQGTSATSTVDITTTNAGAWIVDSHYAGGNWNMVAKNGRTPRWNFVKGSSTQAGSTLKATTAGTFTLDWMEGLSASQPWVIVAAALKPTAPDPVTSPIGPAQRVVEVSVEVE